MDERRYRIDERECDFGDALAALHALIGRRVCVGVRGASPRTREPALLFTGIVERGVELGGAGEGALAIEVAGVLIYLSERNLLRAWQTEYADRDERWLSVGLVLRGGLALEIDELGE